VSLLEVFPAYLLDPEREAEFIVALRRLPIPEIRKKQVLVEWCAITGVALTREMVEAVLVAPYEV